MIRVAIGVFILFGAVGYEDMMIEMNDPQPLLPFVIKVTIGAVILLWGVKDLAHEGAFRE
jgi:hypothetical protein